MARAGTFDSVDRSPGVPRPRLAARPREPHDLCQPPDTVCSRAQRAGPDRRRVRYALLPPAPRRGRPLLAAVLLLLALATGAPSSFASVSSLPGAAIFAASRQGVTPRSPPGC